MKTKHLGGRVLTSDELRQLATNVRVTIPTPLAALLTSEALVGLVFGLSEAQDESGLGADFKWMTCAEMIDEANEAFPGILAVRCGFLPIGQCLVGSGDPYFLRLSDGAVVRIPHDAARGAVLDCQQVEQVMPSIPALLNMADISS